MAQIILLYKTPKDANAFDRHYFQSHVPMAKKLPGLRKYEVSTGMVATPNGPSPFHLIATLRFDNLAAIQKAIASEEGQATAADVATFATGGVDVLICDTREV